MRARPLNSLRVAALALARRPRFALGATALLGVTLFALGVVGSLLWAVLLRPLPFVEPGQLVAIRATVQRETLERREFSRPDFIDYQQQLRGATAAAYGSYSATLRGVGAARVTPGEVIDASYFAVLQVAPALGRAFTAAEANSDAVLISDALWRERFGARADAIGRSVLVDGHPLTVSGVMPSGFAGVTGRADIWMSFEAPGLLPPELTQGRGVRWHEAIARLAPGVDLASLDTELAGIAARLAAQYPDSDLYYAADALPLREELLGPQGDAIAAAAAGVGLLLLIAVLNLGGLALVRATSRSLEHAMRRCLGASPARLFGETVAEGVVLGLVSGVAAAVLAWALLPALTALIPIQLPRYVSTGLTPGLALAIVAAGALSGAAAFVLGGLIARRAQLASLRAGTRATRQHATMRRALVGGEIALGVALLAAALLLARTFAAISALDTGYRVQDMVAMDFELPTDRYDAAKALLFGRQLVQLAKETPGVENATLGSDSPLSDGSNASIITSERLEPAPTRTYTHAVLPGFFATTGIALAAGRDFSETIAPDAEGEAIVSAALARKLFPGENPLGKRLKNGKADSRRPWLRVVGVAADTRWRGLPFGPTRDPDLFQSLLQRPSNGFSLLVATHDQPLATAQRVAERLRSVDPEIPVSSVQSMRERVQDATQIPRFLAALGLVFAFLALVLSALGVYAIAALDASQRTRELAIRQALGSDIAALARLFAGEYGRIFAAAIAIGLLALVPLARVLESRLYGVGTSDPWSLAGSAALFAAALLLGLAAPLMRVLRVQPAELMRGE